MQHIKLMISGHVQGVWYRASAKDIACRLGLTGFARNEPDGRVYIEVEGSAEVLEEFISWCKKGPPLARVDQVEIQKENRLKGFRLFEIRY